MFYLSTTRIPSDINLPDDRSLEPNTKGSTFGKYTV